MRGSETENSIGIHTKLSTDDLVSFLSGADSSSDLEVRLGFEFETSHIRDSFQFDFFSRKCPVRDRDAPARQDTEHEARDESGGQGARLDRTGG